MKLLVIDECYYSRFGIIEHLKENTDILSLKAVSMRDAINSQPPYIELKNKDFILYKKDVTILLEHLKEMALYNIQCYFSNFSTHSSIFSHQEDRIIYY
ncbi:hypothetical protein [Xenorhabdus sp. SGI240]|uniref:hypothetical protein n=1 Tax=Xenorhabdus sp. SGI240 TaxID=3158262 RepID=UPI0032B7F340